MSKTKAYNAREVEAAERRLAARMKRRSAGERSVKKAERKLAQAKAREAGRL